MVKATHTTITALQQMSPEAQQKLISNMNRGPRGDLIILLLALLNTAEENTTQHRSSVVAALAAEKKTEARVDELTDSLRVTKAKLAEEERKYAELFMESGETVAKFNQELEAAAAHTATAENAVDGLVELIGKLYAMIAHLQEVHNSELLISNNPLIEVRFKS